MGLGGCLGSGVWGGGGRRGWASAPASGGALSGHHELESAHSLTLQGPQIPGRVRGRRCCLGPCLGWGDRGAVTPHGFSLGEPTAKGLKLQTPTFPASGRPAQSRGTGGDATTQPQDRAMFWDFPAGPVGEESAASAGDMGSIPGPGRSHLLQSNKACVSHSFRVRALKPVPHKKGPGNGEPTRGN